MSKHNGMEQSARKPWIVCSHSLRIAEGFNIPANFPERIEKLCNVIWENELTNTTEELSKIEAFVPGYEFFYGEKILSKFPNLKCVSIPSKGLEHVDVKYLQGRGIAVGYAEESQSEGVAEFVLTLLFASARYIHDGLALWKGDMPADRAPLYGQTIQGKTLGIVGMGSIGKLVAKKASGFDMKIVYHNRRQRPEGEEKALNVTYHPTLSSLLRESDFVVLIMPLTPETAKIIGEEQFRQMKSTATLINVGRGGLVDQEALVHALRTKQIRAAALDTTTPEPLPRDHPLLHMQNVIVTPHMASATEETKENLDDYTIANLMAGLKGDPLPYPVS